MQKSLISLIIWISLFTFVFASNSYSRSTSSESGDENEIKTTNSNRQGNGHSDNLQQLDDKQDDIDTENQPFDEKNEEILDVDTDGNEIGNDDYILWGSVTGGACLLISAISATIYYCRKKKIV
eukprot:750576_1